MVSSLKHSPGPPIWDSAYFRSLATEPCQCGKPDCTGVVGEISITCRQCGEENLILAFNVETGYLEAICDKCRLRVVRFPIS